MIAIAVTIMISVPAALEGEIGTAAVVDPDAPIVRSPAVTFTARTLAALLGQTRPTWAIRGTVMPLAVVRRA
jgi:hypothetical protein